MTDKQLNKAFYQPDHFWTGGEATREPQIIASIPKRNFKP